MTEAMDSFDSFSDEIRRGIDDLGWRQPMPVQERVIPVMRRSADLIVQALEATRWNKN